MVYSGNLLSSQNTSAYASASRWGTGVNPVHELRNTEGRHLASGHDGGDVVPEDIENEWGYSVEDFDGYGESWAYWKMQPAWDDPYTEERTAQGFPTPDQGGTAFRATSYGMGLSNNLQRTANTSPIADEKGTYGDVEDAGVSDPSQYIVNTSMIQRGRSLDNGRATTRNTDHARSPIQSRLPGQKIRVDNLRGDDMRPKTQHVTGLRSNLSRGVSSSVSVHNNMTDQSYGDWQQRTPLQRQPAGDPYMGADDVDGATEDFGYSYEDGDY